MPSKFVYPLISGEDDYNAEKALVSMYSLRLHNPDCRIVLITDVFTADTLEGKRSRIKNYADEFIVVPLPAEYDTARGLRFIKENSGRYVEGEYIVIDCDSMVIASLQTVDENSFCRLSGPVSMADLRTAAVLCGYYRLKPPGFLKNVRECGIDDEARNIVENPIAALFDDTNVDVADAELYNSPMVLLAMKISRTFPFLNRLTRFFYKLLGYNI